MKCPLLNHNLPIHRCKTCGKGFTRPNPKLAWEIRYCCEECALKNPDLIMAMRLFVAFRKTLNGAQRAVFNRFWGYMETMLTPLEAPKITALPGECTCCKEEPCKK